MCVSLGPGGEDIQALCLDVVAAFLLRVMLGR